MFREASRSCWVKLPAHLNDIIDKFNKDFKHTIETMSNHAARGIHSTCRSEHYLQNHL